MHHFLRSIGFSKLRSQSQVNTLIEDVIAHPTNRSITTIGSGMVFAQLSKELDSNYGISVVGEYDANNEFHMEHYFPYVLGNMPKWEETITVECHSDKNAYSGVSENTNIGIPLIFFLQNITDYVRHTWSNEYNRPFHQVSYGGLCMDAKILISMEKNEEQKEQERRGQKNRNRLIAAAKAGDTDAIESLTLEDIDLYSSIAKRARTEDLYSIVDTSVIPYGVNSEQYAILGTIMELHTLSNPITSETMYRMLVEVNSIYIDIMIHENDLIGEPAVGRRFKGNVWIQGYIYMP